MNLLKFYFIMTYVPLTTLKSKSKKEYMYFFKLSRSILKHPSSSVFTRNYLYNSFKNLDKQLDMFMQTNINDLSSDEYLFFRKLLDLIRNIKRFFYNMPSAAFPKAIVELTVEGLQDYIKNLRLLRRRPVSETILFLETNYYLELAEKLADEAEQYYIDSKIYTQQIEE